MGEQVAFSNDIYLDVGGYGEPLLVQIVQEEPDRAWCQIFHDPTDEFREGSCYATSMECLQPMNAMEVLAWVARH